VALPLLKVAEAEV
jgi:hypothetical protein